jgi:hypothetical protein
MTLAWKERVDAWKEIVLYQCYVNAFLFRPYRCLNAIVELCSGLLKHFKTYRKWIRSTYHRKRKHSYFLTIDNLLSICQLSLQVLLMQKMILASTTLQRKDYACFWTKLQVKNDIPICDAKGPVWPNFTISMGLFAQHRICCNPQQMLQKFSICLVW